MAIMKKRLKMKKAISLILWLALLAQPCFAEIEKSQAIRAIIGEASSQGFQGMLAIACGIRNRGTLKGVYGLKAKHIDKEPEWVWKLARKAWKESATNDITNGATNWENIKAFGEPYWVKSMIKVYEYKDHVFYKKKNISKQINKEVEK